MELDKRKAEAPRSFPTSTGVKSQEGVVCLRVIRRSDLEGIGVGARQEKSGRHMHIGDKHKKSRRKVVFITILAAWLMTPRR
ncbi:hypothetical protein [Cytobacillus sp. IB215665]|uniref:hypothetical protein n=1 Tax=Cytobacillus sp. IB215665 TaxID=3097357 RepID=UPI002A10851E|nr:hypothetical protein [Cytobacillus sp. IB215665]MDX8364116.1 hypothetical protein [Cytobacillus sp. IB215665]